MRGRAKDWTVADWMTDIPIAIGPNVSVGAAFLKMRIGGFRHLLVVSGGRLLGIVTDRDLRRPDSSDQVQGWEDLYYLDDERPVAEVMTENVHTVLPETPLREVVDTFLERRFGAVPVLDEEDRLVGILTQHDVMRATRDLLAMS